MSMDLNRRTLNVRMNLGFVVRGGGVGDFSRVLTAGVPIHAASMPFTDQIKAEMTNAQRLETSVLEHTVRPSPR